MTIMKEASSFHYGAEGHLRQGVGSISDSADQYEYRFNTFFHPYVNDLIKKLTEDSLRGMLDPTFLAELDSPLKSFDYQVLWPYLVGPEGEAIDLSISGPYASYNWELLFHIPVMIAIHLSKNQRFAEAQRWFHYVFDPTSTDLTPDPPDKYWRFLAFRNNPFSSCEPENPLARCDPSDPPPYSDIQNIHTLLNLLSSTSDLSGRQLQERSAVLKGYDTMTQNPFQPHKVARLRPGAYQWYVVMKYLDNLIAWGDNLFMQNSIETINEATLCYVLAANILGPRPGSIKSLVQ